MIQYISHSFLPASGSINRVGGSMFTISTCVLILKENVRERLESYPIVLSLLYCTTFCYFTTDNRIK